MPPARPRHYENTLVALLALSLGFTILDRVTLTQLASYILTDLGLHYTDLGLMASALSVTLAISGYGFGIFSDRAQNRKMILVVAVAAFSLCSIGSGLAVSLATMIAARLLMGLTEGPILPLSYSIVALESSEHRRSFNMGLLANAATFLVGGVCGPIVLTHLADAYGWRAAFYLAGVPGLILAVLIYRFVREVPRAAASPTSTQDFWRSLIPSGFGTRNVWLCTLLTCGLYTWLLVTITFMPIYLVRVVGLKPTEMGLVSSVTGISGCTLAIGVAWLADRIGRKPTMIVFSLMGLLVPMAAMWAHSSVPLMTFLMFLGWSAIGCSPLYAGTIPSESVKPTEVARTLAMIIGIGEVFAGVFMPTVAGAAADRWGLDAPFWIVIAATVASALAACFLQETLPSRAGRLAASLTPREEPAAAE